MPPYEEEFARIYDFVSNGVEEKLANDIELNFIQKIFRQSPKRVLEILDIGCGKGRFLVPLSQTGYQLTGIDFSHIMLEDCQNRLESRKLQAKLMLQNFETFKSKKQFDAIICMDSVICYILNTENIISTLSKFRKMLSPRGIIILEIWNILAQYKLIGKVRSRKIENDKILIKWTEQYIYKDFTSIFHGIFRGTFTENKITREFFREEVFRAMTVGELKMYLKEAGFINIEVFADFQYTNDTAENANVILFVANNP